MEFNLCELLIKKLTASDVYLIESLSKIQKENIEKEKSFYFIYQQSNLKTDYFEALSDPCNSVFYAVNPGEEEIIGVVHYRVVKNTVKLNHVLFKSGITDLKTMKSLIIDSLKALLQGNSELNFLDVDVFEKNKKLLNFLLSLGMEISTYNYWYDITSYCNKGSFESYKDYISNRFSFTTVQKQKNTKVLHYNNSEVGILIRNAHLVINSDIDYHFLKKLNFFFKDVGLESVSLVSKKELELFLIDKSFHLTIPINRLKAL